jgi:hypothetical protein
MEGPPFKPSEQQLKYLVKNLDKVSSGMRPSSSQNTKVTKYHFLKAKNYDQNKKRELLIERNNSAELSLSILLNPFKVSFLKGFSKKDTLKLTFNINNNELKYNGNNERIKNALIVNFNSILSLFELNKDNIDNNLSDSDKLLSESERLLSESKKLLSKSERLLSESERLLSESKKLLSKSEELLLKSEKLLLDSDKLLLNSDKLLLYNLKFLNDLKQTLEKIKEEIEIEQKGGKPAKYKSTGITVFILYKNKKYNRTIYVKDKGKTKYCKINNEYILLSKLKVI